MKPNDQTPKTLRLDGIETTLVFAWTEGVPALLYHGRKLDAGTDLTALARAFSRPLLQGTLDVSDPVSLHPEASRGFAGHPALDGRRPGTQRGWTGRFGMLECLEVPHGTIFRLEDASRGLALELECRIDAETDVAIFRTRLTNLGDTPFMVDWLAPPAMAPEQRYGEFLSFHGRWCAEFEIERLIVPMGAVVRENRRGRTSHDAFPGVILLTAETGEGSGACFGCHLGWSGNHRLVLERQSNGDMQLQMGTILLGEEGAIEPGETMETPPLYVAQSDDGLNALSQKFHNHVRHRILKLPDPEKPRPVTVNTWEAIYFDHHHDKLTALADAASEIGAERFVLDDGWFRGRRDDTTSLGDWYPDDEKYPNGLGPIADYVHERGMQFGLWVEPEMVSPKSDLFRSHPDWVLGVDPYPLITGRGQLVLDIARPDVSDYLFERLADHVAAHGVDYLKWDMNRDLTMPGGEDGAAAASHQVQALYALIDRLLGTFPSLEIESCASGGGRVDYGILKRTHRVWVSDSNDAVERLRIQAGLSYFLPPEIMGSHIGPAWSHTSGRGLHAGFRALAASFGHMGVEADLIGMSHADREIVRHTVERHKADRDIWHQGLFSRVRTVDPGLSGVLAITTDRKRARLIMTQAARPRSGLPPRLRIEGLLSQQVYRITLQYVSEGVDRANRRFNNPLWTDGLVLSGDMLAAAGLGLPAFYPQTGLAIAFDAIEN
ncbi:MAG: alpha-galactosidase [Geminicoccaceae bacterium]